MSGIMLASVGNSYGSAPVNTVAPAVTGTATVRQTLSTTNGTWTGAPAPTFTYQWQRVTTNISGATSSTYVIVDADVGNTIRCVVTATNSIAPSGVTANSNSTASVAAAVPGAPTIGTATQTGSSTATVAYTAPASNGGSAITVYTATSSPGSITGTLSQAGSGTITVSGLNPSTSYTFTVKATNAIGQSAASAASNSITTAALALGDAYGGGYYAGQISTAGNGTASFNLVIGPLASAKSNLIWGGMDINVPGATSRIDGPANTAATNNATYPAAQFCAAVSAGGYSDWYFPAINELDVCYYGLKPTTASNSTSFGINDNSVPKRTSNYTTDTPAQTSAAIFQTGGAQAFSGNFWASTQYSARDAWGERFANGSQTSYQYYKNGASNVRAVRRIAV